MKSGSTSIGLGTAAHVLSGLYCSANHNQTIVPQTRATSLISLPLSSVSRRVYNVTAAEHHRRRTQPRYTVEPEQPPPPPLPPSCPTLPEVSGAALPSPIEVAQSSDLLGLTCGSCCICRRLLRFFHMSKMQKKQLRGG